MALFDRFKTKPEEEKKPAGAGKVNRVKKTEAAEKQRSGEKKELTGILLRAHLTEKTVRGTKKNAYAFAVKKAANKFEIKRAVEGKYGVTVEEVRTLHSKSKERRRGVVVGTKPGFKKAIVTVKEGQKIEIQ